MSVVMPAPMWCLSVFVEEDWDVSSVMSGSEERDAGVVFRLRLCWAALVVLMIVGVAVRIYHLERESAYFDEVVSFGHLDAGSLSAFLSEVRQDDTPMVPFYFSLQYLWACVTGGSLYGVRLLSVFFWVLSAWMLYVIGGALYGRSAGLVAVLCSVLSVAHVFYAQELRPYALVMLLSLCSTYSLWRALALGGRRWWVLNVVLNVLLVFSHLFTGLFLLSQGCFLGLYCLRRKRVRSVLLWTMAHVPGLLLLALWMWSADFEELGAVTSWIFTEPHSHIMFIQDILMFSGVTNLTLDEYTVWGGRTIGAVYWRLVLIVLMWAAGKTLVRRIKHRSEAADDPAWTETDTTVFLLILLVVPSLSLFGMSWLLYPCHASRYILYSSMAFFLIVGGTIASIRRVGLRIFLVCLLAALFSYNLSRQPGPWRPDYRGAAAFVEEAREEEDPILVFPSNQIECLLSNSGMVEEDLVEMESLDGVLVYLEGRSGEEACVWLSMALTPGRYFGVDVFEESLRARGYPFVLIL